MPSDFSYRDDSDVYVTVYWGEVSIVDILDTILKRAHDSDLRVAKAHLIDLSHAAWVETPPQQVHQELERHPYDRFRYVFVWLIRIVFSFLLNQD